MDKNNSSMTRRGVMKGIGGIAALSMSNATIADAQAALTDPLPSDPHTADTYRSIVDAIIPRTPQLEAELGSEHVPGGLDAELEKFLIWDFNHFQEIRSEMVTEKVESETGLSMPTALFEFDLDLGGLGSPLDALLDLADLTLLDLLDLGLDTDELEDHLDFGAVDSIDVGFADLDTSTEGIANFEVTVDSDGEQYHQVLQNYPYAPVFTFAFDVVAAEFLAKGKNEEPPAPNEKFPAGGTFTRLAPEDRLRCLWTIVDGGVVDDLDELLSPMLPDVGILKYVVMAVNGLHGFGYYTEWSGYGSTKAEMPNDREMEVPAGEVQSRTQTDYPGPAPGYAANWRHAVPGGFKDPKAKNLNLPDDLAGDDVIDGLGGGSQ